MSEGGYKAIGITLWETTQIVNRAFERVLAEHGGNRAVWFIYLSLVGGGHATQRDLARDVGITDATLTHHLNALEQRGFVVRTRDGRDRRVQRIELTAHGREAFETMRDGAAEFDRVLRTALGDDAGTVYRALKRLAAAVDDKSEGIPAPLAGTDPSAVID